MRRLRVALALLLAAAPARAAFEELGAGARAPGLGDAFTALADDAYALHYNPAGLAQVGRPELGASYSKLYAGLSDGSDIGTSQLVYAQPLKHGREGTLGVGWDRFALSGLYQEQTLALGYGRHLLETDNGTHVLAGLNLKYLNRSFSKTPEADNACAGLACNQGPDPVLAGATSKSTPDADLGALVRLPGRLHLGLMIQHLTSPNVGFASSDRLQRAYNLGAAYKSLWMSLVGEIKNTTAPDGSAQRELVLGAERYFPTLDHGQFGLRGSLGFGTQDWRQATFGGSYRINKIQADYAFILPIGAVKGTSGSHRIGLTFHFGAPTADDELTAELLQQARDRERRVQYGYEYAEELRPQSINDARLAEAKTLIGARRFRLAQRSLTEAAQKQPLGRGLTQLESRLRTVADHYAELGEPASKFDRTLQESITRLLAGGDDRVAVLQLSYAASMKPGDALLSHFLDEVEKATGVTAMRLPPGHPRGFIDELQWQAEYAHTRGDDAKVQAIMADLLVLEPDPNAPPAASAAPAVSTAPVVAPSVAVPPVPSTTTAPSPPVLPSGTPLLGPTPLPSEPTPKPAPRKPSGSSRLIKGSPQDVEALYQAGVEHYAHGEYLQATAMFLRILQIDPNNEAAQKAIERIDRRKEQK